MLIKVKLHNFRQHQDLELDFQEGLAVIRGQNEAGKSTIFEAITFALFGVRACRNNDLTTWGEVEGSHKVELWFESDGISYKIKRNSKSAELNYEHGRVTGQTEVSRFCEQVLNIKPNMGNKLMFIPQGQMKGILDEGSAKATATIEALADLDLVDNLISALQDNFTLGKSELAERLIEESEIKLEEAKVGLSEMVKPDDFMKAQIKTIKSEIKILELEMSKTKVNIEKNEIEIGKTESNIKTVEDKNLKIQLLKKQVQELESQIFDTEALKPDLDLIAETCNAYQKIEKQYKDYKDYSEHEDYSNTKHLRVKGNRQSVEKNYESLKLVIEGLESDIRGFKNQISEAESKIIDKDTCPTCKQKLKNAEDIAKTNERMKTLIGSLLMDIKEAEKGLEFNRSCINKVKSILDVEVPDLDTDTQWSFVADGEYPPLIKWVGDKNITTVLKTEVERLRQKSEKLQSQAQVWETQSKFIADWKSRLKDLNLEFEALGDEDLAGLKSLKVNLDTLKDNLRGFHHIIEEQQDNLKELKDLTVPENFKVKYQDVWLAYESQEESIKQYACEIEAYKLEISSTRINNALLKCLREVKPKVANQVWQKVCQTTSHYFSLMRDQQSIVAKEGGFTVDGHDVGSLSGSTLDVLGIAIRIALTKTFMPTCKFLLLDEPFSACDAERQAKALGFIASAGFNQTIVITHEDTTQTIADSFIEI